MWLDINTNTEMNNIIETHIIQSDSQYLPDVPIARVSKVITSSKFIDGAIGIVGQMRRTQKTVVLSADTLRRRDFKIIVVVFNLL